MLRLHVVTFHPLSFPKPKNGKKQEQKTVRIAGGQCTQKIYGQINYKIKLKKENY
jgi:hypothetical protein